MEKCTSSHCKPVSSTNKLTSLQGDPARARSSRTGAQARTRELPVDSEHTRRCCSLMTSQQRARLLDDGEQPPVTRGGHWSSPTSDHLGHWLATKLLWAISHQRAAPPLTTLVAGQRAAPPAITLVVGWRPAPLGLLAKDEQPTSGHPGRWSETSLA